jgi:hypothetical protein
MAKFGVDPHTGNWDKNIAQSQFKTSVENIIAKYKEASPEFVKGGHEWYDKANEEASTLGRGDVVKGAGIIAALSPQKGWAPNLRMAHELSRTGTTTGQTDVQLKKAQRILAGEHPTDVLNGPKETNFFHNISDPSNPHHVTVDRHAHDIAVGKPFIGMGKKAKRSGEDLGLGAMGRYKHFVHAYQHAAGELEIPLAHQVQATTWVQHRGAIG